MTVTLAALARQLPRHTNVDGALASENERDTILVLAKLLEYLENTNTTGLTHQQVMSRNFFGW